MSTAGELLENSGPGSARAQLHRFAQAAAGGFVSVEAASMQLAGVACGLAQGAIEVELEQTRGEVAIVRNSIGDDAGCRGSSVGAVCVGRDIRWRCRLLGADGGDGDQ